MALVTGIKFILTWVIANWMFIILAVVVKNFAYDNPFVNNMPPEVLQFYDFMYAIWIAQIIIIPSIILITAWREAERKAASEI